MYQHTISLWEFGQTMRYPAHILYRLCCCGSGGEVTGCDCDCLTKAPTFYSFTRQVRWALEQAELQVRDWLGVDLIPTPQQSDLSYGDKQISPYSLRRILDRYGRYRTARVPRPLLRSAGQYAATKVVSVTNIQQDANSQRFTATAANVPNTSIASDYTRWLGYHTDTNLGGLPREDFPISPLTVAVKDNGDGSSDLSISGPREVLTMPAVLDGVGCDNSAQACFAPDFDLYQIAKQCAPDGYWLFPADDCTTSDCEDDSRGVCVRIENLRTRSIRPAPLTRVDNAGVCESSQYELTAVPDKIRLYYVAGIPLQGSKMDARLVTMVSKLAAHYLFTGGMDVPRCKGCGADGMGAETLLTLMNTIDPEGKPVQQTGHLALPVALTKQDTIDCPLRPLTLGGVSAWHDSRVFTTFIKGMEQHG